jgi:DNA-binding NtrC family response regulator
MATILHVDDDEPSVGLLVQDTLTRAGHRPMSAGNVAEALQVLARGDVDLIVSDDRMPGLTGLEFLALLQRERYDVPLIMLTGCASIEHAIAAIKAGAIDCIMKPVKPQQLELAVQQALELVRLRREHEKLRRELMELRTERQIVGDSVVVRGILQTVAMAAHTRAAALLQGETGTGKELFARAIHDQSDRRDNPFIKLSCAGLDDGLIESALFGHERGAFPGASKRVDGAFERANGGTLLLDGIAEMKLDLQAKLLRVLQEQEFTRVGGTSPIRVDVRVVATTSRDLALEAAAGTFRQDLYDRLSVMPIVIPPLRDRADDIPLLAYRFAARTAAEIGKEVTGISHDALSLLMSYPWPGNVRELQQAVERAVIVTREPLLQPYAFEGQQLGLVHPLARQVEPGVTPLRSAVGTTGNGACAGASIPPDAVVLTSLNIDEAERALILRALEVTKNNRTRTAELLGISVRTLRNKLNGPRRIEVA